MGLYNNDDVDHLSSVQRGYKSCCISGQFILNDEEFRTYGFQDQPGYWYPSNSEMRANKIKQVPGDLKLRTDKDKTRKQGARSLSSDNKINHFSCSIPNYEKLEKE